MNQGNEGGKEKDIAGIETIIMVGTTRAGEIMEVLLGATGTAGRK